MLKGFADHQSSFPPVLVNLYGRDTAVFSMIMSENEEGTLTVFVPASPALTVGVVHVVNPKVGLPRSSNSGRDLPCAGEPHRWRATLQSCA